MTPNLFLVSIAGSQQALFIHIFIPLQELFPSKYLLPNLLPIGNSYSSFKTYSFCGFLISLPPSLLHSLPLFSSSPSFSSLHSIQWIFTTLFHTNLFTWLSPEQGNQLLLEKWILCTKHIVRCIEGFNECLMMKLILIVELIKLHVIISYNEED